MIPPLRNFPLSLRLILTGAMFCFNLLLFAYLSLIVIVPFCGSERAMPILSGHFSGDSDKYLFLFAQAFASMGTFALTALAMAQLETSHVAQRLALKVKPALPLIVIAVIGILSAQAFIQFLVELNQKIPLPDALKFLVEQGKEQEGIMNALLSGSSPGMFLANTFVLAIVPALAEEFFFRGLVLGGLLKSKANPVFAVIITGLLFSLAHMEYENFLAIWVLGAFLGYLYYVSGSLWLSVVAHFTNNFLLILLKYLYNSGAIKADVAEADVPILAVAVSTVVFILCWFALNKWRRPVNFELELSGPDMEIAAEDENYIPH